MGFLDLNAMILLTAVGFGAQAPIHLLIFTMVCQFAKALISIKDIGSAIDFGVVVLLLLSIFIHTPAWILFIWALNYPLPQKARRLPQVINRKSILGAPL